MKEKKNVLLNAIGISKRYGSGGGEALALSRASLKIYEGELLVILGSSGSGKSTLLNLIGGMDRPSEGRILVDGEDICTYSDRRLTEYRRKNVGFVFQSFNLLQELTARENVALTADTSLSEHVVDDTLAMLGLANKGDHYPSQLSGGEQQRVSVARALAKRSRFLLCDEPTGALDYETGRRLLVCLEEIAHSGKTVVIVTHTREIARMADRVVSIRSGRIEGETVNDAPCRAEEIQW